MKKRLWDWLRSRTYYREAKEIHEHIEWIEDRNSRLEEICRMQSQLINSEYRDQMGELPPRDE